MVFLVKAISTVHKETNYLFASFLSINANSPSDLVAIRKHQRKETHESQCLRKTSHANVVNLLDAFLDRDIFYFAYELMEVSLGELSSCMLLGETHISFICKEVRWHLVPHC